MTSSPRPAAMSTKSSAAAVPVLRRPGSSRRATAVGEERRRVHGRTEVPGGPLGAPVEAARRALLARRVRAGPRGRAVQGVLHRLPASRATRPNRSPGPPSVVHHPVRLGVQVITAPPWGVRPPDRIGPPVDPCTLRPSLRWVTCSASTTFSADTRRGRQLLGRRPARALRAVGRGQDRRPALDAPASAGAGRPACCRWSSRCAAGPPRQMLLLVAVLGVAQLAAGRRGQRQPTSPCW